MYWYIVEQKVGENPETGEEITAPVKRLTHIPIVGRDPKTGKVLSTRFIKLKDQIILKVVLQHSEAEAPHWFTYNANTNTFAWHKPDKMDLPVLKNGNRPLVNRYTGKEVKDLIAKPQLMKGEKKTFTPTTFQKFLRERVGQKLADKVLQLVAKKMTEVLEEM